MMKTGWKTVVLFVLLALSVGCTSIKEASPETHVANARAIYTTTVLTMSDLVDEGHVGLELALQFEKVRVRVAVMLEEADDAVAFGYEFSFANLADSIESLTVILTIALKGTE